MSGIVCGGCGAPLSHINEPCLICLPGFYGNPAHGDRQPKRDSEQEIEELCRRSDHNLAEVLRETKRLSFNNDQQSQRIAATFNELETALLSADPYPYIRKALLALAGEKAE